MNRAPATDVSQSERDRPEHTKSPPETHVDAIRNPHPVDPRFYDSANLWRSRERNYYLRAYQKEVLATVGKFRIIAADDLAVFLYQGHREEFERDLLNLERQGLIQSKHFQGTDGSARELLALTRSGYRLLRAQRALPEAQATYYGFVKPKESNHDANLYRVFRKERDRIARAGGRNLKVILDFEMKKKVNHDFSKYGAAAREEIAAKHGLRVIGGKIPVPDLRIEYETPEGNIGRVDLELATEHYRPRQLAQKVRAGFSLYASQIEADHLRRILDQHELTAELLTL